METKGVVLFNKGERCIVRAIVALSSLRKFWDGDVTFFLEKPYPAEFVDVCNYYNVRSVIYEEKHGIQTLVRKTEIMLNSPYDRTLWLDADTLIVGRMDEMFDYLDNCEVCIPHFAGWWADGRTITKRINNFKGKVSEEILSEALGHHPAVNTGILSYRKNSIFMKKWVDLAIETNGLCFISDEISFQVLYPSYKNKVFVAPQKFNVSIKYGNGVEDKRCLHAHGQKHCIDLPLCSLWKSYFEKMMEGNEANIRHFVEKYPDKRLSKYLVQKKAGVKDNDVMKDVTVVTACDPKYVEFLRITYPTWVKYKKIDQYPMIVFVNGMPIEDTRLDFLRSNKNAKLVPWDMPEIKEHRELMLNAFVFGTAKHVMTDYWLKLDADSYAVNNKPLISDKMKEYAFCGHKWSYSKPDHIRALDEWAKGHWKKKLRTASPMISEGRIDGRRFYHNRRRTISYIQLHKTRFTRFCVGLLKEERLPAPTQDTFMFFVCDRFDPHLIGVANFKRHHGFMQGNSRLGIESLVSRISGITPEKEGTEEIEDDEFKDHLDIDSDEGTQIENESPRVSQVPQVSIGFDDVVSMVLEKKC